MSRKTQTQKSAQTRIKARGLGLKTRDELAEMARQLRVEIAKTYLEIRSGRLKNTRAAFNKRKELARVLTALQDKVKV